jgi:Flagellar hook capping protein
MSTVNTVNTAATSTSAASQGAKNNTLGQEQFLTLLIAQLKHQDPLNPSDPTEFTTQLAQYSQLEQLFNLNSSMDQLTAAANSSERYSALSLIGQEVVVEDSAFILGNEPVQIGYKIDGTVADASLVIKNSSGQVVATLKAGDLSQGNHFLTWDGQDSNGNTMAPGTYSISINATSADGSSATIVPLVRSQVTGIDMSGSEAKIITALGEYKISALYGAFVKNQNATGNTSG